MNLAQDILSPRLLGAAAQLLPGAGLPHPGDLLPGAVHGPGEPGQGPRLVTITSSETLPGQLTAKIMVN